SSIVQTIGLFVCGGGIRLLHQVSGLLHVFLHFLIKLFDLLGGEKQILRLLVVTFIPVATPTTALPEKILAFGESPSNPRAHQHHVGGVTRLTAGLGIPLRKQRPQPMLVSAVSFFHTGCRAAISLMAR